VIDVRAAGRDAAVMQHAVGQVLRQALGDALLAAGPARPRDLVHRVLRQDQEHLADPRVVGGDALMTTCASALMFAPSARTG